MFPVVNEILHANKHPLTLILSKWTLVLDLSGAGTPRPQHL